MAKSKRRRVASRGLSAIEIAIGVSIVGSILAAALPTFVRELHASHLAEPLDGLEHIGEGAVAYAEKHGTDSAFPASAPLTPSLVPHGARVVDAPGTWETPTWQALAFRPAPEGAPHAFAFAFTSTLGPSSSQFMAEAHGDLDGDGVLSTFEVRGTASNVAPPAVTPGMYVEAELE